MGTERVAEPPSVAESPVISALLDQYASRPVHFAGKTAPAYKLANTIDRDPAMRAAGSRSCFCPSTAPPLAERRIGASDDCNPISTAGYETSGTINMKFMKFIMNGALRVGTPDGATIETAAEAGEGNLFLFGLTRDQVAGTHSWYNPRWHYDNEPETREALDLIFNNHFSRDEPGIFEPIRATLLERGDFYMHLADLTSYAQAQQCLGELFADADAWARKAIINVACSGKFSSDRTIAEYATDIWNAIPCPVD